MAVIWSPFRVSLWNKRREFLRYIHSEFNVVWAVDDIGTAEFTLSTSDPACRREFIQFGNYVLFEHAELGDWAGVIAPNNGRGWDAAGVVSLRSLEASFQFHRFRGPLYTAEPDQEPFAVWGTAGELVRKIIAYMNVTYDSGLREGDIWEGPDSGIRLKDAMGFELMDQVVKRTGIEWWVTPARDDSNRLVFKVNTAPRRGTARHYTLREGINVVSPSGEFYREDGEIVNDEAIIVDSGNGYERGTALNESSLEEYGPWMATQQLSDEADPEKQSKVDVERDGEPRHTFILTAIESPESPDTFQHIGDGDVADLSMYSGGLYQNEIGIETQVRIMSREFNSAKEKELILNLEEVLE